MVGIDPTDKKYIITFKPKDQRPNQRDDKFEIFRSTIGLADVRDVLDIGRYKENHMHDPILKTKQTVTDINSFQTPFIMARLTADQANRLRKNPNIALVEEDSVFYAVEEVQGWQVPKVKADTTWAAPLSVRGAGVNVGILDTGCLPHIDFGGNVKVNQNFTIRPGTGSEDAVHHGTHVAGICGAAQGNNEGVQGIAPSCNLWNLRAGDNQGMFTTTDMIEGVTYATQNNAHVFNMSISGGGLVQSLQDALTALFNTGCVIMGAAGNTGRQETATYPANFTGVIGISNLAIDNNLSVTSTWGTMVDFTTPGRDIVSLGENNLYRSLDGTSMACPCASGIAALMLSAYNDTGCPPYSPGAKKNAIIEAVMRDTAIKTGLVGAGAAGTRDIKYGYGLPQANVAVASLKGVLPAATIISAS